MGLPVLVLGGDANDKLTYIYVPKYKTVVSETVLLKSSSSNSFQVSRVNFLFGPVERIDHPVSRIVSQKLDLTKVCLPKHCTKVNQTFNLRT